MTAQPPRLFNIPSGASFADALARGILQRYDGKPERLADCVVLLPSRRACRTLRDAFLRISGAQAMILPRLVPVGEADADEIMLLSENDQDTQQDALPPPVGALERRFLLAQLIEASGKSQSFDQALMLADTLAQFLDNVQSEGLSFERLAQLAPDIFAAHWGETLKFLSILTTHWPRILSERTMSDVAAYRLHLLEAQMRLWDEHPPQHPVIAAGVTGIYPVHRALLRHVAQMPEGVVVLSGLDTLLEDDVFDNLPPDHPQFMLHQVLKTIGAARGDVETWMGAARPASLTARARLLTEALRPANNTDAWRRLTPDDLPPQALSRLTRVDAATPQEEADIIAMQLREALETPGKTAALVTPDRRLARRVTESLKRWDIHIDDTGGQPLSETPVGRYLLLLTQAAAENLAPVPLLCLLKHPFATLFADRRAHEKAVLDLDRHVLRGPRPDPGLGGLYAAYLRQSDSISEENAAVLTQALDRIKDIFAPLLNVFADAGADFSARLTAVLRAAEDLAGENADVWRGEAGEAGADFFAELLAAARHVPKDWHGDDHGLLRILMKDMTIRPRWGSHPRLSILGVIEARLYMADLVILGGLNEGTWPALPPPDPWMSAAMRRSFGLPASEKMVGIAAHDFVQGVAGAEVLLTRALREGGAPTVPARWLQRMDAVLKAVGLEWPDTRALQLRGWRLDMDMPAAIAPALRPAPCPPLAMRPRRLSVTKIGRWMSDPYQIYAEHILGLRAFDPIDADPGGAERGIFIHAALEAFIKAYPEDLPQDAVSRLLDFGRKALKDLRIPREVEAFWWPRFERIADIFVQQEREWRADAKPYAQELFGLMTVQAPGGSFTVSGKADRVDRMQDGGFAIIDYKSGQVPESAAVKRGLAPQLPIEALMLNQGAFAGVKGQTQALIYWKVAGSGQTPVERKMVLKPGAELEDALKAAEVGLTQLITRFDDETTPYYSRPRSAQSAVSDYDYLARLREWAQNAEGDGE